MSKIEYENNNFSSVESAQLLDEVKNLKEDGYRFCHICADKNEDGFELIYSFEREDRIINLKTDIALDEEVSSITFVYWTAFGPEFDLVKNFGIKFKYVATDYVDEFYQVEEMSLSAEAIRREIELLAESKDYRQMMYAAERLPGTCSFGNSLGYCMAVEKAAGIKIPERAEYLRVVFQELSRIQSHMMWLASLAEHIGFEGLSMKCWALRENILNIFEKISGNRIMLSICKVGGMKKDVSTEMLNIIVNILSDMKRKTADIVDVFVKDSSVNSRLAGIGTLDRKTAEAFCVGPVARASGAYVDARNDAEMSVYKKLEFMPVLGEDGDCMARCKVRIAEIFQSMELVEKVVAMIPEGSVSAEVESLNEGEASVRIEQPEGQAFYYVKTAGQESLKRLSVRLPEDINMPAFVRVMQNCELADVPLLALTMEPCLNDMKW